MSLTSFIYLELFLLKLDSFHTSSINCNMDVEKKQSIQMKIWFIEALGMLSNLRKSDEINKWTLKILQFNQ